MELLLLRGIGDVDVWDEKRPTLLLLPLLLVVVVLLLVHRGGGNGGEEREISVPDHRPLPPIDVTLNANGERVVTEYSTSDRNDLTGATNQPGVAADFSLDAASQLRRRRGTTVDDLWTTGEQDAASGGARRRRGGGGGRRGRGGGGRRRVGQEGGIPTVEKLAPDHGRSRVAGQLRRQSHDDDDDDDDDGGDGGDDGGITGNVFRSNSFASPYGFVGFDPDRVPSDVLSASSPALRACDGRVLRKVLSEYELRAIEHDGHSADDRYITGSWRR